MNKIKNLLKKYGIRALFQAIDRKIGFGLLERLLFINWFNPLLTIYLNFRSFPLRQAWKLPIFVYGRPRLLGLSGTMRIEGPVSMGMISFNKVRIGAPSNMSVQSEIRNNGEIIFHGKGHIGTGNRIIVGVGGILDIGSQFTITDMCNIGCFIHIKLGDYCRVAHRSQLLEGNYHYVANFIKHVIPDWKKPIQIGRHVWICNSSTITGGSIIPDEIIIASNSLVNKDFSQVEKYSIIGGQPAKYIATGVVRVENYKMLNELDSFYRDNADNLYNLNKDETPQYISQLY